MRLSSHPMFHGVAVIVLCSSGLALAKPGSLEDLAERLIELRSRVESLQEKIESQQQNHRNRMNSLAQRRASLDSQIQGQELQLRQLRQQVEEQREQNIAANESARAITPAVKKVAKMLEAHVDGSIPFEAAERKKSAQEIIDQVENGTLTAPRGLNRLWTLYEDEFRLTRENGLFRHEIVIDGDEQLADVLRLGTMMMFFRTSEGAFGHVKRSGDSWTYAVVEGGQARRVEELFDAFEKQVRSGYFTIPNALVGAP